MQNNESVCAPAHNRARGTHMQRCFNVLRLHRGGLAAREQLVIAPRHGTGVQIRVGDAQQQLCAMLRVLFVAGVLQQRAKLLCTRVIPISTRDVHGRAIASHRRTWLHARNAACSSVRRAVARAAALTDVSAVTARRNCVLCAIKLALTPVRAATSWQRHTRFKCA